MRHYLLHHPELGVLVYGGSWLVPLMWAAEIGHPLVVIGCFVAALGITGT